jgi:hypothetical protein
MTHQQPSDGVQQFVWKTRLVDDAVESGREDETAPAMERVRGERDDGHLQEGCLRDRSFTPPELLPNKSAKKCRSRCSRAPGKVATTT